MPDGGFSGRLGGSDIYYTDFALRTLLLLGPQSGDLAPVAGYLSSSPCEPADLAECFNLLNCLRMLRAHGSPVELDTTPITATLAEARTTPYNAFLAALCCDILGTEMPGHWEAAAEVSAMQCPDGGFSEVSGATTGQTNSTSAAIAFLTMSDALQGQAAQAAVSFLAAMQTGGGGFLAHAAAPEPDLLSTFTALTALSDLAALDRADLAAAGRFVRSLAEPAGGFRSCDSDPDADIEYTYYGVAVVALLRDYVATRGTQSSPGIRSP